MQQTITACIDGGIATVFDSGVTDWLQGRVVGRRDAFVRKGAPMKEVYQHEYIYVVAVNALCVV
jgi:hypothetical protein